MTNGHFSSEFCLKLLAKDHQLIDHMGQLQTLIIVFCCTVTDTRKFVLQFIAEVLLRLFQTGRNIYNLIARVKRWAREKGILCSVFRASA